VVRLVPDRPERNAPVTIKGGGAAVDRVASIFANVVNRRDLLGRRFGALPPSPTLASRLMLIITRSVEAGLETSSSEIRKLVRGIVRRWPHWPAWSIARPAQLAVVWITDAPAALAAGRFPRGFG